ncbi:hypothetical protein [Leptospira sarikeiensis]|uniref:Nucleotidyltransferase family protein n=1 Tax=Leptospira sarikeiensis TaxID=2484943 RepID=A0A4R9KC50_9LEPT|nr:hypothetical protein [Leptospira sarikeiensis]TGL63379.1 hypothetical protein EHQ64_05325 [Leptospira sarikeiensis]
MDEPDWASVTEEKLWKFLAWHLSENGIDSVLVGGAVVSVYSEGLYRSGDLDIAYTSYDRAVWLKIQTLMKGLGFNKTSRHFIHPKCKHLFVEYVSPPISIGEDYQILPAEKEISGKRIKLLSPTDCIKDRLASYVYFKARECLDQAILVAKRQPFLLKEIKRWCDEEGGEAKQAFLEFKNLLS